MAKITSNVKKKKKKKIKLLDFDPKCNLMKLNT
jgi:hypothetical protein